MASRALPTYRRAAVDCALTVVTGLICVALLSAAALVPAPPGLLPVIVAVCVGVPMVAAWRSSVSLAALRAGREVRKLRRELDQLPEIRHPLGL